MKNTQILESMIECDLFVTAGNLVSFVKEYKLDTLHPDTPLKFYRNKDKTTLVMLVYQHESTTDYMMWAKHYYKVAIMDRKSYDIYSGKFHKSFSDSRMQLMWHSLFLAAESGEI